MAKDTTKNISIKEAAEIMGKSPQFLRLGLQIKEFPFGTAIKMSSMWTYYINPKKFYEYVGLPLPSKYYEKSDQDERSKADLGQ